MASVAWILGIVVNFILDLILVWLQTEFFFTDLEFQ